MAALELLHWRKRDRGTFVLTLNRDGGLVAHITLPDSRVYTAALRPHHTHGKDWYEGFVTCSDPADAERDQLLNADGILPEPLPRSFNLWPCQMKLSPSRFSDGGGYAWYGRLWVSARDARPRGEVYSIFANRQDAGFSGYTLRYRPR